MFVSFWVKFVLSESFLCLRFLKNCCTKLSKNMLQNAFTRGNDFILHPPAKSPRKGLTQWNVTWPPCGTVFFFKKITYCGKSARDIHSSVSCFVHKNVSPYLCCSLLFLPFVPHYLVITWPCSLNNWPWLKAASLNGCYLLMLAGRLPSLNKSLVNPWKVKCKIKR